MQLPEQVILTCEQHWPGLQVGTATSVHWDALGQPPLSTVHEYSQYVLLVSLHILHIAPGGHCCDKQAAVIKTHNYHHNLNCVIYVLYK